MIVKNRSVGIGKTKAIEVRPMVDPESIDQPGSFQRGQSGVFMKV